MAASVNSAAVPAWVEEFHGHLCPFLVVGWRMGQVALARLGVDRERDQGLFLLGEMGGDELRPQACYLDGLQAATGCSIGKGTLRSRDYGKVAAVLTRAGQGGLRIALRPEVCDDLAKAAYGAERRSGTPASLVSRPALADAVRRVAGPSADELFTVEDLPDFSIQLALGSPTRIRCASCNEYVFEQRAVVRGGRIVCLPCAGIRL